MALVRWEPFREVESLQQEMNRLFDSLTTPENGGSQGAGFVPAAEMHETPYSIELRLELPGMEAKDIDVRVTKEAVAISGERQFERKTEEGGMSRSEFRYGKFQRVIPLPAQIQNDKVQADYKNGVLSLSLPKIEEEKNKVFKVNLG
jgi:HSP20 family protein